jgi:hypothetical protein
MEDLTSWLKKFHRSEPDEYAPPPLEVVLAYLEGTATAAERLAVRAACLRSRSFRREIVELSRDLERLDDPAVQRAMDAFEPPEIPSRLRFLASRACQPGDSGGRPGGADEVSASGPCVELVQSILAPLSTHRFVPVVLRSVEGGEPAPSSIPASGTPGLRSVAEPGGLAGIRRGTVSASTAEDAAIRSFMDRVQWTGDGFRVLDDGSGRSAHRPRETGDSTATVVFVHGPRWEPLLKASFDLPAGAREPRIWVLLLPSLLLLHAAVTESPLRILWPAEAATRVCLALTYAVEAGYQAEVPNPEAES